MRKRTIFTLCIFFLIFPLTSSAKVVGEYPKEGKVINSWKGELFPLVNGSYWRYIYSMVEKNGKVYDEYVEKWLAVSSTSYGYYKKVENYSKEKLISTLVNEYNKKREFLLSFKREQLLSLLLYNFEPTSISESITPFYLIKFLSSPTIPHDKGVLYQEIRKADTMLLHSYFYLQYDKKENKMHYKKSWAGKYFPIRKMKLGEKWINWTNSQGEVKKQKTPWWGIEYEVMGTDLRQLGKDNFVCYIIGIWDLSKRNGEYKRRTSYPITKLWVAPDVGIILTINDPEKEKIYIEKLIEYYRPDKNFWWYTSEKIVPDIPPYVKGVDRRPYPRLTDDE